MSIRVKIIDIYGIEEKLKKNLEMQDVLQYINSLKEALKRQQELTAKAISKIKELSK